MVLDKSRVKTPIMQEKYSFSGQESQILGKFTNIVIHHCRYMIIWWVYEKMEHDSCAEIIAMSWCACLPETISGTGRTEMFALCLRHQARRCKLWAHFIGNLFVVYLSSFCLKLFIPLSIPKKTKQTRYAMQQCRDSNLILQLIFPQFCFLID